MADLNAAAAGAATDQSHLRRLETARETYRKLSDMRIGAGVRAEQADRDLEQACAAAREAFGTDDHEQLLVLAGERREANERSLTEFEAALETVKESLRQVGKTSAAQK